MTIGGRYKVRELIGVGGMDSTVWKAWQTGTERTVAIKVLPPADEAAAKRFARGARIAANLTHPNCLVIHDYGATEDGKLYLVMEFLPGQVLTDVLGDEPLGVLDTLHVADQVLQALEHAHSRRAVHRDLKPDNLFVTRKNDDALHIKILDYGIAKYIEEDPTEPSSEQAQGEGLDDQVTEQRQVCGTPQYMAPEQVVGGRVDARTDIYSLGVVMYRMLTGRLPFDGKTRYELYQKHLQEAPPTFRDGARPDVGELPRQLELVVMRALAKNPGQRFQAAAEMRRALQEIDLEDLRPRSDNAPRVSIKSTTPHGLQAAAKKGITVVINGIEGIEGIPEESAEDFAPPTLVFPDAPIQPRRGTVSLQASVPAPSQTEPNSSEIGAVAPPPAATRPQRRWLVAVVLIAAFLVGVGGVAGLMALLRAQPAETAVSEADPTTANGAPEQVGAGTDPLGVTVGGEEPATPGAPDEPILPSELDGVDGSDVLERVGAVAGGALGEIEAPPEAVVTRYEFHVDSVPRGAEVRVGAQGFGETPAILSLPAGQHTLTLNLKGYAPEAVVVQVGPTSRPADLRRTMYLSRKAAPPVRRWTPRATDDDDDDDDGAPTPRDTVPDEPRKPRIDLLDELEPTPKKKPSVQLLDDVPDPVKKPPTTEVKPKPKPKPKVDLLDQ